MSRSTLRVGAAVIAVALAAVAALCIDPASRVPGFRTRTADAAAARFADAICDLRHPIDAHLVPLDPMAQRGPLRVALDVQSAVALTDVRSRVLSTGGAELAGPRRAELGTLDAGESRRTEFALNVPQSGHRFVLQVLITAESATGPMNRLVMLNVLPDGPADPGRVVTTPAGAAIREYASSARRIER